MVGAYLHSFILAKALGIYMIIMAIVMISRANYYRNIMQHIETEKLAVMSGASFGLVFGTLLLSVHNFWGFEPYVLVTIIAWLIVIKSVLWLAIPESMARFCERMFSGPWYYVLIIIMGCVGIWILSYGVFLFGGPFPLTVDIIP